MLIALQLLLKGEGFQIESANSPAAILEKVTAQKYDVLLMDMNYARDTTSGREGLDLISRIRMLDQALPVIAMTAWASVELAVEAMQRGLQRFCAETLEQCAPAASAARIACGGPAKNSAKRACNNYSEPFRRVLRYPCCKNQTNGK